MAVESEAAARRIEGSRELRAGLAMLSNGEAFQHFKSDRRIVLYPEEAMAVLAHIELLKSNTYCHKCGAWHADKSGGDAK